VAPVAGLLALVIVASNAFFNFYLADVRMYPLLVALSAILLWLYLRLVYRVRRARWADYVALGAAAFCLIGTHAFGLIFLVMLGIYHLIVAAKDRTWIAISAAVLAAGLLFAPYLWAMLQDSGAVIASKEHVAIGSWEAIQVWFNVMLNERPALLIVPVIGLVVAARAKYFALRPYLFMFVAYLVWFLPFLVVYVVVLVGNNQEALPATDSLDSFGAAFSYSLGVIGIGFGQSLVALLPTVAGWILGPAIAIALAQRMELADAFKFGNVLAWVAQNWVQCLLVSLIAGLMSLLISVVAALTGALALGIGLIVTFPFGFLMSSIYQHHLFGQLAQSRDLTVMFPELANPG
jgi:hypothetical protein